MMTTPQIDPPRCGNTGAVVKMSLARHPMEDDTVDPIDRQDAMVRRERRNRTDWCE